MYSFHSKNKCWLGALLLVTCLGTISHLASQSLPDLKNGFMHPPASARPGVYWYFADGNMTKESITSDLESMKQAGLGSVIFLEVNVGLPQGPVDFFSEQWKEMFAHAVRECKRLGIEMSLGMGPGWNGSGGPWVKPEQSMQQLVGASVSIDSGETEKIVLPVPEPKASYFGVPGHMVKKYRDFYEDVAVLAYPTPPVLDDAEEKSLYYRPPFTSKEGVKQSFPATADYQNVGNSVIPKDRVIDLTGKMKADGKLEWNPPSAGNWTITRFGRRNNGASTRPAPIPGLGFECDKFDTAALNVHLNSFVGELLKETGKPDSSAGGLKRLHIDSWEMGAQNWTKNFREEFKKRRGYDPLPFYPVYLGYTVESLVVSERFLWDLRQTAMELVLENHAGHARNYAHRNGLELSIEPYDMNPNADLELGAVADLPMGEFWSKGYGFNASFSIVEATAVAHISGKKIVAAEAFTSQNKEGWKQYPGSMKNQGDWAFAAGINRLMFHTFQNQFLADSLRPGATMGPYGVSWNLNQTWWPMAGSYHDYISRCQYLLQQGSTVADILYLTPEGAPQVFLPPTSALTGETLPDRKEYNFDGVAAGQLYTSFVKDGRIVFPGGTSYRLLVLPVIKTMTPPLLRKIASLVKDGATVLGGPPLRAPGLSGYPQSDIEVAGLANELWGDSVWPKQQTKRNVGKGQIIWGGSIEKQTSNGYPSYELAAGILRQMKVEPDFSSTGPVRYTHRSAAAWDIYFVSNTSAQPQQVQAAFRTKIDIAQIWNPQTMNISSLRPATQKGGKVTFDLQFHPYESYFVVFAKEDAPNTEKKFSLHQNTLAVINGPWMVRFDSKWGGPDSVKFNELEDWTLKKDDGIKCYSGIATYTNSFDLPINAKAGQHTMYLDLGDVENMARVKLNGKDLGVLWTAPWQVDISGIVQEKNNKLEIEVANLWANRLIGDEMKPDDGIKDGKWPEWLRKGLPRSSGRYTFTTTKAYTAETPLLPSGLLGPVTIRVDE